MLMHIVVPDEIEADSLNLMLLLDITTMSKAVFDTCIVMFENWVSSNLWTYCPSNSFSTSMGGITGILCLYGF